jgi:hypothetical protein
MTRIGLQRHRKNKKKPFETTFKMQFLQKIIVAT